MCGLPDLHSPLARLAGSAGMLLIPNRGSRPVGINRFTIDKIRKGRVSGSCVLSKYEITTSFVMAQTLRAVVVELAGYSSYIDYSRCISGYPVLFASGRFRETT